MSTLTCLIGYTINIQRSNGKGYEDTDNSAVSRPWRALKMITIWANNFVSDDIHIKELSYRFKHSWFVISSFWIIFMFVSSMTSAYDCFWKDAYYASFQKQLAQLSRDQGEISMKYEMSIVHFKLNRCLIPVWQTCKQC